MSVRAGLATPTALLVGTGRGVVLRFAAAVENGSERLTAAAIVREVPELLPVSDFVSTAEVGVSGVVEGRHVAVGRLWNVSIPPELTGAAVAQGTVVAVSFGDKVVGSSSCRTS